MIEDCKRELLGFQEGLLESKKIIEKFMIESISQEIKQSNDIINSYSAFLNLLRPKIDNIDN